MLFKCQTMKCEVCRKIIHKTSKISPVCWERKKYCSRECSYKSHSLRMQGKNNPIWKGNKVGMAALHEWVGNHKPKPKKCECCNDVPPYDLANKSGLYKRDLSDWNWFCRKCHMILDGRLDRLHWGGD